MTTGLPMHGTPIKPLCKDAEDDTKFCQYAGTCHEPRQRLAHRHGLRGTDCWAWTLMQQDAGYPGAPRVTVTPQTEEQR